ncbi:cytochrome P450 306a1-like [Zophobas morio]|uniref:cytochrome P450 306a1-like n=1 Tax=Zophobas morio TaxID=2755281 RepID=UPI0030839CE7
MYIIIIIKNNHLKSDYYLSKKKIRYLNLVTLQRLPVQCCKYRTEMITTVSVVITTILTILFLVNFRNTKRLPGPWTLPIIGYLPKLDPLAPYLILIKLVQKYGPVYRIKLGSINVAVIADAKILKKVLAKDETLARPPLYMINTAFKHKGLAFAPMDLWKEQRKFLATFLRTVGAVKVSPKKKACEALIRKHVEEFVQAVKSSTPIDPLELLLNYVSDIAGMLLLGKPFSLDNKMIADLQQNFNVIAKSIAFGGPLNFLPILRFLPQFKNTISALNEAVTRVTEIQNQLIDECSIAMGTTNSASNLIEAFLLRVSKGSPKHIYNIEQLNFLLLDVFIGSTSSTTTSLFWMLLYLAQYDQVQNKVRQELFEVLQNDPAEMKHFESLHYTKATIAEVTRIRTIAPLGIPHYASEDICVEGFTIRKGTMITPLLWAIHMDPNIYERPEEFRPERFLDADGKFCKSESLLPFLSGKRFCVGEELAMMIMSLFISTVLRNFRIQRLDSFEIDFTGDYGVTLKPKPQKIMFVKI